MANKLMLHASILLSAIDSVHSLGPVPVDLGIAAQFTILAKAGIATVPDSRVTGNIGVSPIAATAMTGFSLTADSSNEFSTSDQVDGQCYAANYVVPTPCWFCSAIYDMEEAYTDAMGRPDPTAVELNGGALGGLTLAPGIYKFSTSVGAATSFTLEGSSTDTWIFQIAQQLTMAADTSLILAGGAQAENIVWAVAGYVAIGARAHLEGTILTYTAVTFVTGSSLNGRIFAQTRVDLQKATVSAPVAPLPTTPEPPTSFWPPCLESCNGVEDYHPHNNSGLPVYSKFPQCIQAIDRECADVSETRICRMCLRAANATGDEAWLIRNCFDDAYQYIDIFSCRASGASPAVTAGTTTVLLSLAGAFIFHMF
jgi:hypothetical protein